MNKNKAFNTIVDEFTKDMELESVSSKDKFTVVAKNLVPYLVTVSFKDRDNITEEPRYLKVTVEHGPHTMHNGQWVATDNAAQAARVALATLRNTDYMAQGELL